jgi:hypothetical protein
VHDHHGQSSMSSQASRPRLRGSKPPLPVFDAQLGLHARVGRPSRELALAWLPAMAELSWPLRSPPPSAVRRDTSAPPFSLPRRVVSGRLCPFLSAACVLWRSFLLESATPADSGVVSSGPRLRDDKSKGAKVGPVRRMTGRMRICDPSGNEVFSFFSIFSCV